MLAGFGIFESYGHSAYPCGPREPNCELANSALYAVDTDPNRRLILFERIDFRLKFLRGILLVINKFITWLL
jgi:hypothetical protein